MIAFIDDNRGVHGVEPNCNVLLTAPSTYHKRDSQRQHTSRLSARVQEDMAMKAEIARVFADNFAVYGVRKVWQQIMREGFWITPTAISTHQLRTDRGCPTSPPPSLYVATWAGFVFVAFVIDLYARYIVGWRASRTAHARFVLHAHEQALNDRRAVHRGGLAHHSHCGSRYVSIKYIERPTEAGIKPSVGSVGDSFDNALAETINGHYKAEVIHRRGPWRSLGGVEYATLEWVDWFNNRRLLVLIGSIPPAEAEEQYDTMLDDE